MTSPAPRTRLLLNLPALALAIISSSPMQAKGLGGGTGGNNRFDNLTVKGRAIHPNFDSWALGNFTTAELAAPEISGPDADPAHSGISNFLRHAMGISLTAPLSDASGASVIQRFQTDQSGKFFRFRYNPAAKGLVWRVQAGSVPGSWTHVLLDSDTSPLKVNDGWVTVPLPDSLAGDGTDPCMFVRLRVSSPEAP